MSIYEFSLFIVDLVRIILTIERDLILYIGKILGGIMEELWSYRVKLREI